MRWLRGFEVVGSAGKSASQRTCFSKVSRKSTSGSENHGAKKADPSEQAAGARPADKELLVQERLSMRYSRLSCRHAACISQRMFLPRAAATYAAAKSLQLLCLESTPLHPVYGPHLGPTTGLTENARPWSRLVKRSLNWQANQAATATPARGPALGT